MLGDRSVKYETPRCTSEGAHVLQLAPIFYNNSLLPSPSPPRQRLSRRPSVEYDNFYERIGMLIAPCLLSFVSFQLTSHKS